MSWIEPNEHLPSETELFRAMRDLLEGIAQIAENHGFKRGDDLQVWLARNLRRCAMTDEMVFAAMQKADELGQPLDDIDARQILVAALALTAEADGNKPS
jgi:hypothetical protein